MRSFALSLTFLLCGCHYNIAATTPANPAEYEDPPGRVARLSYAEGTVSFRPAGGDEWVAAGLNRPFTTGDALWTEGNSRAELQLGAAVIRLGPQTNIEFLNLNDQLVQVKLAAGILIIRLRQLDEGEDFEIDTPVAAVSLLRSGEYRFQSGENIEELRLTVRSGEAEVSGAGAAFTVHRGDLAVITGTEQLQRTYFPAPTRDAFDRFSQSRDQRLEEGAVEAKQVPAGVIGYEDLAGHGVWHVHATWGPVWAPTLRFRDWVPYRYGHWVWVQPWGWVWVDDEPWGFAPFHYGRWVHVQWGWCWVPPPPRIRPVWAPALVVFVGGGRPDFRVHFWAGFAGVAWFPLGPREVYVPPYRSSRTYITNINVRNTMILRHDDIHRTDMAQQHYANQRVANAITAVPRDTISRGRPVAPSAVHVPDSSAASARIGGTAPPVAPSRESLAGPASPATRPPDSLSRRRVVAQRQAAPSAVPFEQTRERLERYPGRPAERTATTPQPQHPREDVRQTPAPARRTTPQATPPQPARERRAPPAQSERQWERRSEQIQKERKSEQQQPAQRPQHKESQGGRKRP